MGRINNVLFNEHVGSNRLQNKPLFYYLLASAIKNVIVKKWPTSTEIGVVISPMETLFTTHTNMAIECTCFNG